MDKFSLKKKYQSLYSSVFKFFDRHITLDKPILLALSGGVDSLALFYLLLEYRDLKAIKFYVAHIDHGWREESSGEAQQLKVLCESFGVSFFKKRLTNNFERLGENLEDFCRKKRLSFFKDVCIKEGCQAVFTGHHAGDQAETVLKRLFESSCLLTLKGIELVTYHEGLVVWRPLLSFSKSILKRYLEEKKISYFVDETNKDLKFLRPKMREKLIPQISETFGKEIESSLCYLGRQSENLEDYMKLKTCKYFEGFQKGVFGSLLDLSKDFPEHIFEREFVVRQFLKEGGFSFSRSELEGICLHLLNKSADCYFKRKDKILVVDRRCLFLMGSQVVDFKKNKKDKEDKESKSSPFLDLVMGFSEFNRWTIKVEPNIKEEQLLGSWKDAWKGSFSFILPKGFYQVGFFEGGDVLSKWFSKNKVPAFLRGKIPLIFKDGKIYHEALTGRRFSEKKEKRGLEKKRGALLVSFSYIY